MAPVRRRYASLYFIAAVDAEDNELLALQTIHFYVEVLDKYFGNVCELDLVFNFHKAFYTLDEVRRAPPRAAARRRTPPRRCARPHRRRGIGIAR